MPNPPKRDGRTRPARISPVWSTASKKVPPSSDDSARTASGADKVRTDHRGSATPSEVLEGGRRRADLMVIPRSMRWDPKPWPGSSAGSVSMPCMPRGRSTTSMSPSPMTVGSGISGGRRSARSPNVTNRVGPPSAAHPECVVTGRRTGARRSRYRSWSRPGGAAPRFATATTVLAGTTVSQEDAPLFGGIHGGRRPRSTSRAGLTSDRAPDEDCCRWVRQRCHRSFLISSSAPSAWLG